MRTHRRPLAIAAGFATALFGVGILAAQPAAAAVQDPSAAVTDCGTTATLPNGMLDVDLLQGCLDHVQASLGFGAAAPQADEAPAARAPVVAPSFDALDVVFSVDVPGSDAPAAPVAEVAPVADGPGDAFVALA